MSVYKGLEHYASSSSESESSDEVFMANTSTEPEFDVTATVVGDFGNWQLWISILMSLMKLSNAWFQLNIVFMAPLQEFWCAKPEQLNLLSDAQWRELCKPPTEDEPCLIYDPDILATAPYVDRRYVPLVPCTKFVYNKTIFKCTIVSDWDLVCDRRWLIHATQGILMTGILIGGIIFGMMADTHGRRKPLMFSIVLQATASFMTSLCYSYWTFICCWFTLALACGGITGISFVLCLEVVSGKWRTIIPVLYQAPFGLGNTVMALLAYYYRDWRKTERGLAFLSSLYILYWFFIPESPRWLLAHGQPAEAVEVLYAAAKQNGRREWTKKKIQKLIPNMTQHIREPPPFSAFMRSRNMRIKTLLLSTNWFITGLAFYTFSQFLGGIGGDIFKVMAISGFISVFGPILGVVVILFYGRKETIWFFQVIAGLSFLVIIFIPRSEEHDFVLTFCGGIGFAAMAAYIPTLYLYSGELFPTLGRNKGVSLVTMFARIGSMVAPLLVALDSYIPDLPLITIAVLSASQLLLLIPLPETKDTPLPNTLEEAEMLGKSNNKKSNLNLFYDSDDSSSRYTSTSSLLKGNVY